MNFKEIRKKLWKYRAFRFFINILILIVIALIFAFFGSYISKLCVENVGIFILIVIVGCAVWFAWIESEET